MTRLLILLALTLGSLSAQICTVKRALNSNMYYQDCGSLAPGWSKYALVKIANGVNGCAAAGGCWQVNGVLGAIATVGSLTQDVTLVQLAANAQVSDWRIKTATACAGATTIKTGLGVTGSAVLFRAQTYDVMAAVSATNLTVGPTAGSGTITAAAVNLVASLITTVEHMDDITAGCAVDYWILWGVLP
jgi:hypothetical protein